MIRLNEITKGWKNEWVLEKISFSIPDSSVFCMVGMSGSGKSLITKIILGLEAQDSGEVWIDNQNTALFREKEWQACLSNFGVVFQNSALFSSLTIMENIGMRLWENHVLDTESIKEKVAVVLQKVGLSADIANKYPDELSGGMKKRVAIARAIIHNPRYIIYDEPTTGLDPINADMIDNLIFSLSQENKHTAIVVTHDFDTVRNISTHVAMLHNKHIHFYGNTQDFLNSQDEQIIHFLKRVTR